MWYLKKVNSGVLDIHVEKLKNGLAKRIKVSIQPLFWRFER